MKTKIGATRQYTPTYDAAGDVTDDPSEGNQYLYDAEGRICAVSGPGGMTGYLYDADGNRVAKGAITAWSCDPTTSHFTMTQTQILGPGGEQLTEVDWSGSTMSNWHTDVYTAGGVAGSYSLNQDPETSAQQPTVLNFYLTDWLGTRRVTTDWAGNVEASCLSLPYGNGESCTPTPDEHLFTGKERDTESGNDYFGARYYASTMGRFLIPDWSAKVEPIPYAKLDNPQSMNLYAYVGNNPLAGVDPDGHFAAQSSGMQDGYSHNAADAEDRIEEMDEDMDAATERYAQMVAYEMPLFAPGEDDGDGDGGSAQQTNNAAVNTVYNETGGLRPDPSADPNSAQHLQTARENVAHVYKNTKGKGFQSSRKLSGRERSALRHNEPDAVNGYASSRDAVNAAYASRTDPTGGASHIYLYDLSPNSTQSVPAWVTNGNPTTVEGPFINAAGGGDVRAGALVLVLTIKDQQ